VDWKLGNLPGGFAKKISFKEGDLEGRLSQSKINLDSDERDGNEREEMKEGNKVTGPE
jgi:hypothetical protein